MAINTIILMSATSSLINANNKSVPVTFSNNPIGASILCFVLFLMIILLCCAISDFIFNTEAVSFIFDKVESILYKIKNIFKRD